MPPVGREERKKQMIMLQGTCLCEERGLFYTTKDESEELGCIGHLRGDFGANGKEFHSNWFPHRCEEKNDDGFKIILDAIVNEMRTDGHILSNRASMFNNCYPNSHCRLIEAHTDMCWGFRYLTRDYAFYIRCLPLISDYNFYIYCYHKDTLMNALSKRRGLPRYCYSYLPTTKEEIRIDFAEHGYTPYRIQGNARAANEMNRELGVSPAQVEAMKVGSMFGWNVPGADPKSYDSAGKPIRRKEEREER